MEIRKSPIDLTDLAIGIVVLGIVVSIGGSIFLTYKKAQVTSLDTGPVTEEALTGVSSNTSITLSKQWVSGVDACTNASDAVIIGAGNYTVAVDPNFGTGTIIHSGLDVTFNTTNWECNYTIYNQSDPRFSLPNNAEIGLGEYGDWFKIIVIVGVAALVISLIFLAFGGRGEASEIGGSY